VIRTP
jgi:predicted DNA-binding transcriptional regulator YafY